MELLKKAKKITLSNIGSIRSKIFKGTIEALVKYALKNNIEVFQLFENKSFFILKKRSKIVWIHKALTSITNPVGVSIARDKYLTKILLEKMSYPTSPSVTISEYSELKKALKQIPFPVVVKPVGGAGGKGVTVNITTQKLLRNSFTNAKQFDRKVLIEKYILGDYYRITYIADGSFAATKNLPAKITGDGKRTVKELIQTENKYNKERFALGRLKKIKISDKTERFLATEGYVLTSVIPRGKSIPLCFSGFDGGEYIDVTEDVHPYYLTLGKKITATLGLPIVGIDIIAKSLKIPLEKQNGVIIEINGTFPDIQFHNEPTLGKSRNLASGLIKYLFKK